MDPDDFSVVEENGRSNVSDVDQLSVVTYFNFITALGCAAYCYTTVGLKSRENSCELSVGKLGTLGIIVTMSPDTIYVKVRATNLGTQDVNHINLKKIL